MFRWVYIEESLPRDYRLIMANTNEGLQGLNFWGYVLIFLSILILLLFLKKRKIFLVVFAILTFLYGGLLLNRGNKVIEKRRNCLNNGIMVKGIVTSQGKSFNPYALRNYYTIDLKVDNQTLTIRHKSEKLWNSCPVKIEVIGFKMKKDYFFGPELGCIFKLNKHKDK